MNGALQVLRLELGSDFTTCLDRIAELESLPLTPTTTDANLLARAAVAFHHAYGAFEAALARIAKIFETEPSGTNWHRSLLETMAMEVPGIRPAIVTAAALPALRELLAFRHFFRHAYAVALDPARLASLRTRVTGIRSVLQTDRERTDAWLASLANAT